jgi:hypothetical protein
MNAKTARRVGGFRITGIRRVARKPHPGCWGDCPTIEPGDVYLESVTFPGHDSGYATHTGHPERMCVCAVHAELFNSGCLDPLSLEQCLRLGIPW